MSSRPWACRACCMARAAPASSETSATNVATRAPGTPAPIASAVRASASALASTRVTAAPCAQKMCAQAAPMPPPPPVISAALSASLMSALLFRLDAVVLDHLAPARDLGLDPCGELLRRPRHDLEFLLLELVPHLGHVEDADDLLVVAVNDGLGRCARREEADPRHGHEVRVSLLDHRGHVGHRRKALGARRGRPSPLRWRRSCLRRRPCSPR